MTTVRRINYALNPTGVSPGVESVQVAQFATREWATAPVPSPAGLTTAAKYTLPEPVAGFPHAVAYVLNLDTLAATGVALGFRTIRVAIYTDRPGLEAINPQSIEDPAIPLVANQWTQVTVTTNSASTLLVQTADQSPAAPGDSIWITDTIATLGTGDPGPFFSGHTPPVQYPSGAYRGYTWQGTPHQSPSLETYHPAPTTVDQITVEVLLPAEDGAFILSESLLDAWPLGDRALAHQWVPIEAEARYVGTHRGGSQDGVAATMQVGTATVELVNPPPRPIRPSTPIRIRTETGTVLFTGTVENQTTAYERRSVAGFRETITVSIISAVDAVNTLANTMRYGAVVETSTGDDEDTTTFSYETFEARADRLMRRTGLPYEIAPNDTFLAVDHLFTRSYFLPTLEGIEALWHPSDGVTVTRSLGPDGFNPAALLDPGTHQPGEAYIAAPIHNLVPGETYRVTSAPPVFTHTGGPIFNPPAGLGIVGMGYTTTDPSDGGPVVFEFVAGASTHHLMLTIGEPVTVQAGDTAMVRIVGTPMEFTLERVSQRQARGQNWFCQSIVYESTLVNHLDVAVNTVRGRWWVDRNGVTRFARGDGPTDSPALTFSDQPDPGTVSYVAVEASEDTARVVNDVVLENHGRAWQPDTGSWVADTTRYTARDATSVATVGPRQAEVPTSIYSPTDPSLDLYGAGEDLARSYVAAYADVEHRISRLRVHVTPDLVEPIAALDVYTAVDATYQAATTEALVVNISHQITQTNWHTELHLIERT